MVICFSCSPETKVTLDRLVASGHYRDHGEVLSAAVAHLDAIHTELGNAPSVVIAAQPVLAEAASAREQAVNIAQEHKALAPKIVTPERFPHSKIPPVFRQPVASAPPSEYAPTKVRDVSLGEAAVDQWIFGQFNRLLPAKVTCRALVNADIDKGESLDQLAQDIATNAAQLGSYLASMDQRHDSPRDEALAIAFPSMGEFKSIQRFANQFVGSTNKEGAILGLPAALKLVGPHPRHSGSIALTEAGWKFGCLKNPLLDGDPKSNPKKFSEEEITFLLDHIAATVPTEAGAYLAILRQVAKGNLTPDGLDDALSELPSSARKDSSRAFVSTQRSGAICRMADLELIARSRTATRVSYLILQRGEQFLERNYGPHASSRRVPG